MPPFLDWANKEIVSWYNVMLNPILVETFIASDQSFQENVILKAGHKQNGVEGLKSIVLI